MNLGVLLGLYEEDRRVKSIAEHIAIAPSYKAHLHQVYGSVLSFIIAGVWKGSMHNHLIIMNDKEAAAYMQNDLEQLTQSLDVCYFPDSFKRAGHYQELNSSHVMLRSEALMSFQHTQRQDGVKRKAIMVTYPEALFEKVMDASALKKQVIAIKVHDKLDLKGTMQQLQQLGFKKQDFVFEPGQFALRGGIFDIYSFGNDKPFRIELFDDEVESIRLFDPESQLSERKLLNVQIVPNVSGDQAEAPKVSLLDFLPEETCIWVGDMGLTYAKLQKMAEELPEKLAKQSAAVDIDEQWLRSLSLDDFEDMEDWLERIGKRPVLAFSQHNLDKVFDLLPTTIDQHTFSTAAQPVFNRQFDLLIKDLQKRQQAQTAMFIFADNPKQLERLHNIFEDLNAGVNFVGIPKALSNGFIDVEKNLICYTDHQIFQRYHKYKVKQAYSKGQALTIRLLKELQPGDYVTHIDHGVGKYSGLQKIEVNGAMQEAVRIIYRDNDVLYVNINSLHKISKFSGKEGHVPKINKLGSDAWEKLKNKTKKQVKDIAADLIKLYAKRKATQGFAFSKDSYLQMELEASFMYEDTPDQSKSTADVKRDMESPSPMDRLVCGDVGFGKTEIAIRAAFKAAVDGKQTAVLVPTTVLAFQHYQSFKKRLKDFPVTVDFLNRFKSTKEKNETLKKLKEGKVDILIGTHAITAKQVEFKDLGLLIIDEEQKFGVSVKEKLRTMKANVDTLTLTATPIPRTLQFSLMNARDLSIINTPPPNRQPVHTEILVFDEGTIRDAIYYEIERGGQVFFIHNRVTNMPEMYNLLQSLCPDLSIGMAHGQLEGKKLEAALLGFMDRTYDVLLCSNIVESGVDIPNANTIIINNAHHFGLSDLHQLRGRVGRSNKKAFCYLLAPPFITLPDESRKRLQTLEQFSDLGSGFQIAMRDLDIRGAGNLLGGEQSGFIAEIGFDMYQKILAEAIRELKSSDFKEVFKEELERKKEYIVDCTIDTDFEILIPENYVDNVNERLALYTQLDRKMDDAQLLVFAEGLKDRFGPLPQEVNDLILTVKCRRIAIDLGFERLIVKNHHLRMYFVSDPESSYFESTVFNSILQYIQTMSVKFQLKQTGKHFILSYPQVKDMQEVHFLLEGIHKFVNESQLSVVN